MFRTIAYELCLHDRNQSIYIYTFDVPPHHCLKFPAIFAFCDWTEGNVGLIAKQTIEAIDKENKLVTFTVFGGDLMKLYKVFKMIVPVIEEGKANYVKWIMEYEKANENVPSPNILMDFGIAITKASS